MQHRQRLTAGASDCCKSMEESAVIQQQQQHATTNSGSVKVVTFIYTECLFTKVGYLSI